MPSPPRWTSWPTPCCAARSARSSPASSAPRAERREGQAALALARPARSRGRSLRCVSEKKPRDRRSSAGFAGAISGWLASDGGAPAPRRPAARTPSWMEASEEGRSPPECPSAVYAKTHAHPPPPPPPLGGRGSLFDPFPPGGGEGQGGGER